MIVHALITALAHAAAVQPAGRPVVALAAMVTGGEVAIVAMVFAVGGAVVIPIARAFARRIEGRAERSATLPTDVALRLERIERALDAIAVEVERISEGQRFVTQVMANRAQPPSLGAGPQ